MTLQSFIDKYNGKVLDLLFLKPSSTRVELFVPLLKWRVIFVNKCVFRTSSDLQVFNSIVGMISVNVMNNIRATKFFTSNVFNEFSVALTLPMRMIKRRLILKNYLTRSRTKNTFTVFVTFVINKYFSTLITSKNALSKLVVTIAFTKSSFLARGRLEWIMALFTFINHKIILTHNVSRRQI